MRARLLLSFTLLRNLPQYFNDGTFSFFNILPDLTTTPSASFADGFMVALPALVCLILFAVLTLSCAGAASSLDE